MNDCKIKFYLISLIFFANVFAQNNFNSVKKNEINNIHRLNLFSKNSIDSLIQITPSILDTVSLLKPNDSNIFEPKNLVQKEFEIDKIIIKPTFLSRFNIKLSLGIQLNQLSQKKILSNHLIDLSDSLFSKENLLVSQSTDSLIPHRSEVTQSFDLVQISIPIRLAMHISLVPWLEFVSSLTYNTLNNIILSSRATLSHQSPSRFIDSTLTIAGLRNPIHFQFNANSLLLGTGTRLHISEEIFKTMEKNPIFVQFELLWNLGYSKLSLNDHFIRDRRFARVGYQISVGTYFKRFSNYFSIEGIISLSSIIFRSKQSLGELVPINPERSYFNQKDWSFTNLSVQFFFYYDPIILIK